MLEDSQVNELQMIASDPANGWPFKQQKGRRLAGGLSGITNDTLHVPCAPDHHCMPGQRGHSPSILSCDTHLRVA
jgi:hypothetical protein